MPDQDAIGKRLAEMRCAAGWKQADVALALGISRSMWAMIETGKASPSEEMLRTYETALKGPKPDRPTSRRPKPKSKPPDREYILEIAPRAGKASKFKQIDSEDPERTGSVVEAEILRCLKQEARPLSSVDLYDMVRVRIEHRKDPDKGVTASAVACTLSVMVKRGLLRMERSAPGRKGYYSIANPDPEPYRQHE